MARRARYEITTAEPGPPGPAMEHLEAHSAPDAAVTNGQTLAQRPTPSQRGQLGNLRRAVRERPGLALSPLVLPVLAAAVLVIRSLFDVDSFILPLPSEVLDAFWIDIRSSVVHQHIETTFIEVIAGFVFGAVAGFTIGSVLARYQFLEDVFYPYIVALQTMPKVAIAPLLVIWLGFGMSSKILVAALISFFPLLVNVIVGLRGADPDHLELMQSLSASSWQTWRMVRLPAALPIIFAGLEVAMVLSMVGAIVGEFVGASEGLGYLIQQRNARLDSPGIYSILVILALMGCLLAYAIRWVGRRVVYWERKTARDMISA